MIEFIAIQTHVAPLRSEPEELAVLLRLAVARQFRLLFDVAFLVWINGAVLSGAVRGPGLLGQSAFVVALNEKQ